MSDSHSHRGAPHDEHADEPLGPGLDETLKNLQRICDEQQPARPITEHKDAVVID